MRRSFTLIELMIVTAIIAVISAIALPELVTSRRLANEARVLSYVKAIVVAQEQYLGRTGIYADRDELLVDTGLLSPPPARVSPFGTLFYGYSFLTFAGGERVVKGSFSGSQDGFKYYKYRDKTAKQIGNTNSTFWYVVAVPIYGGVSKGLNPGKAFYVDRSGALTYSPSFYKPFASISRWAPGPENLSVGR